MDQYLINIGEKAKLTSKLLSKLNFNHKKIILDNCANALIKNKEIILNENKKDIEDAINSGIKQAFIDRLTLDEDRIFQMSYAIKEIAKLPEIVGEYISTKTLANGLVVGQKRVSIGVIGIIFESRPNVTTDAFSLCFKAGSSVVLRGGKESLNSNIAIVNALRFAITELKPDFRNEGISISEDFVQLIENNDRNIAKDFMQLNKYIDLLIPRGSLSLINAVIHSSTIPVIETGTGNCHIFVDESADFTMAENIVINAKTQRPGVCNACEKLLVHKNIASKFLPSMCKKLMDKNVELRVEKEVMNIIGCGKMATEEDWYTEYEDYIIAIKIVDSINHAISHIEKYSTKHSESIVTNNYINSQKFLEEVDSAAVYVNASTRFTDGFEFGFGAEIGISTQKLHARGPMGLKELTTTKYVVYGNGQIRT